MNKQHTEISKFLSFILRHQPEAISLTLDADGWANIDTLIDCANKSGKVFTRAVLQTVVSTNDKKRFTISAVLQTVVSTNDKKRFTISEDGLRIRAAQGHSTQSVDIAYQEKQPPEFLFHGTATRFLESIKVNGLVPGARHYVHLSADEQTAITVGQRHGKPVVLKVKALLMHEQGFKFYLADNGVWLTSNIPTEFLSGSV